MESITINKNHKYIYNTYKELSTIMPRNYLKIKVLPYQRYFYSNKKLIDIIETNYNLNTNNNKNEKPKKNIYFFSSQLSDNNSISEKNVLKDLFYSKLHKNNKSRNHTQINNYYNTKIINSIKNNTVRRQGIFNSSPIKNYFLRTNIRLPSITQRMKFQIPRNEREANGFRIIGNDDEIIIDKKNNKKYLKLNNNDFNQNNDNKINSKNKYCLSEKKENKKNLDRIKNLPFNIVSIVNKNKNTKYNI